MSRASSEHRRKAADRRAACAVLTVSDSRTAETDTGGDAVCRHLEEAGHAVRARRLAPDEPAEVDAVLGEWLGDDAIDVILTTGGTGMARRDTTIEVVERRFTKPLPGFGELFRMLSWQEVGAAAMLSRATAGLAGATMIFAMPGSPAAVELAMSRLIVPELPHLIWERQR